MLKNPEYGLEPYGVREDPEQFVAKLQGNQRSDSEQSALHQPRIYGLLAQRWLAFLQAFIDNDHS